MTYIVPEVGGKFWGIMAPKNISGMESRAELTKLFEGAFFPPDSEADVKTDDGAEEASQKVHEQASQNKERSLENDVEDVDEQEGRKKRRSVRLRCKEPSENELDEDSKKGRIKNGGLSKQPPRKPAKEKTRPAPERSSKPPTTPSYQSKADVFIIFARPGDLM